MGGASMYIYIYIYMLYMSCSPNSVLYFNLATYVCMIDWLLAQLAGPVHHICRVSEFTDQCAQPSVLKLCRL
jgi:hypothetical protein